MGFIFTFRILWYKIFLGETRTVFELKRSRMNSHLERKIGCVGRAVVKSGAFFATPRVDV